MDLFTLLFRLPFLPARGVIKLAELLRDQAEREMYDPAAVRRELEDAAEAERAGEISGEEVEAAEREAVGRLIPQPAQREEGSSDG